MFLVPFLLDDDTSAPPLTPAPGRVEVRAPGPQPLVDPYALGPLTPAPGEVIITAPGPRAPAYPPHLVAIRPEAVRIPIRVPGPWLVPPVEDPDLPTVPVGGARVTAGVRVVGYPLATAAQVQPRLNDVGSGTFTVPLPGPAPDAAVPVQVNGRGVFVGRAGRVTLTEVSSSEEAGRLAAVELVGLLTEWEEVVVLPDFGSQDPRRLGAPTQDVRVFDWTTNGLGAASFGEYGANLVGSTSIDQRDAWAGKIFDLPDVWPDPWARWMWVSDPRKAQPRGWCHFRVPTPLAPASGSFGVWACAHDYAEVWIDGVPVLVCDKPGVAQSVRLDLSRHFHLVTIRAYNERGRAGVLFSALPVNSAGLYDEPIMNSRSGWKALAYPTRTFILTPGQVLYRLRLEAARRGVWPLTGAGSWQFSFDNLTDSAGRRWPRTEAISLDVGMTYLDVLNRLAEDRLDYAADPSRRVLHAWVKDTGGTGANRALPWTAGVDLTSRATKRETR